MLLEQLFTWLVQTLSAQGTISLYAIVGLGIGLLLAIKVALSSIR